MLLCQGEGLAHRFDRRPEHEIPRQLDRIGGAGVFAEIEDPLAHRLLNRSHAGSSRRVARSHNP